MADWKPITAEHSPTWCIGAFQLHLPHNCETLSKSTHLLKFIVNVPDGIMIYVPGTQ